MTNKRKIIPCPLCKRKYGEWLQGKRYPIRLNGTNLLNTKIDICPNCYNMFLTFYAALKNDKSIRALQIVTQYLADKDKVDNT